jgi:uncharacterized membrane protein
MAVPKVYDEVESRRPSYRPYSSADKWTASAIVGLLFLVISSPVIFTKGRNVERLIVFGVSIAVLVKIKTPDVSAKDEMIIVAMAVLLFLLLSSPLVRGSKLTTLSVVFTSVAYMIFTRLLMR